MDQKLCLYVCSAYLPEVNYVLQSGDFPDVVVKSYAYNCMTAPFRYEDLQIPDKESKEKFTKVLLIAGSCFRFTKENSGETRKFAFHKLDHCMELIFSKEAINHFIENRYYIVSNGWLAKYREHIAAWGFDGDMSKKFFGESTSKILLLETGISSDFLPQLKALSDYMGLPYEILPIGISHCRMLIETLIFQWRAENEQTRLIQHIAAISKKTADYALVFHQLQNLVEQTHEEEIVQNIFEMLNIFFSPATMDYYPIENQLRIGKISYNINSPVTSAPSLAGFTIEVAQQGELLGVFELSGIAFPGFMEQYKDMRQIIGRMSSLAIANARKYKIIQANEMQLQADAIELKALNDNKDKFFSIIAHDLRSPFNVFLGLTRLMSEDLRDLTHTEIQKMAVVMRNSATNLFQLLENLLEWSRSQRGLIKFMPESFLLTSMIAESMRPLMDSASKKGIGINYEIPNDLKVFADESMLASTIRNLASNAVKFSRNGGNVIIAAKPIPGNSVEISVRDTGIGMSAKMVNDLFRLDVQTNRKGTDGEPSAGLGLLLCKDFIEKQGGKVWVESEEGKGSIFFFTIPHEKPLIVKTG
ncbi:MAG: HAMP domain-containing sensor histidine kinase [Bacteroidetes bacterium]|nr:HAMP domain-containing sensor histidine kinase [Bacteroidota bacterium]